MCRAIDPEATGARLKVLCEAKQLTVKDVRSALGLSDDRTVYYWFRGQYLPSLDNFYLLAQKLECPIDDILVPLKSPAENNAEVNDEN